MSKFTIEIDTQKVAAAIREITSDAMLRAINKLSDEELVRLALLQKTFTDKLPSEIIISFPRIPLALSPVKVEPKIDIQKEYNRGNLVSWDELDDQALFLQAIFCGIQEIRIASAVPDVRTELIEKIRQKWEEKRNVDLPR